MRDDITGVGQRHVDEIRSINRELVEKALHMRCLGYLSQVKAHLLTETIYEVEQSKKNLQHIHNDQVIQRDLVTQQKQALEQANQELVQIRAELEQRVAERTDQLSQANAQLQVEIDSRRQAETHLREREAFFRAILNSADANIAVLEPDGTILAVNDAWTAFARANSEGKLLKVYVGDNYLAACRNVKGPDAELALAALTGLTEILQGRSHSYSLEYPCHSPTQQRWFLMRAVPLRTDRGGAVVYHINVTHLAEVEAELRQHRTHLEELFAKRTEDLTHAMAELESFSYSIAHDLRSPLRTITSFSQVIREDMHDKFSAEDDENLQRIIKAGKYMAELIDDILALARISRNSIEKTRVDLSLLAEDLVKDLQHSNKERQVEVHIQAGLSAQGDPVLLKLLLENLLNNAWKYTRPRTQAQIEIGQDTIEGEAVFFIRDNGVGFNMQHADNLFRPFYRMHNDEQFEGTGIGLATVQRIVQRHGGRVWIDAEEDKGTTVYFTL